MEELSIQEAFSKMVTHLRTQGEKSMMYVQGDIARRCTTRFDLTMPDV